MKVAFDTSALIDLCENDGWTGQVVSYLASTPSSEFVLVSEVSKQLDVRRRDDAWHANFERLEAASVRDDQRYFTIGESVIGGGDILRGDTGMSHGIQREFYDLRAAYENYRAKQEAAGQPVAVLAKWIDHNNHQADAVIYERALELGCDYLVTTDKRLEKATRASSRCKGVALQGFLEMIG